MPRRRRRFHGRDPLPASGPAESQQPAGCLRPNNPDCPPFHATKQEAALIAAFSANGRANPANPPTTLPEKTTLEESRLMAARLGDKLSHRSSRKKLNDLLPPAPVDQPLERRAAAVGQAWQLLSQWRDFLNDSQGYTTDPAKTGS